MADTALPGLTETSSLAAGDLLFASVGGNGRKITYENARAPIYWGGTAGGTANALTITPSPAISAYAAGQRFTFKTGAATNTGAVTLAVSGLAAQAVNLGGIACRAGALRPSTVYEVVYDGSLFDVVGEYIPRIVTPYDFGAVGDGSTDDSAAFNAALAFIRDNSDGAGGTLASPYWLDGLGRIFKIAADGLDATAIVQARFWGIRNMTLNAHCAGKPAIDISGSRDGVFSKVRIWGDETNAPSIGILGARCAASGTNTAGYSYQECQDWAIENVQTDGYFLDAGLQIRSAEEFNHRYCRYWNRRAPDGSGESWAVILDGNGAKTAADASEYQTLTAQGTRSSFTVHHFDTCQIQKPFGITGPTLYMTDLANFRFTNPYITNGGDSAIYWEVNSNFTPYQVTFDHLQIETTGNETAIEFDGVSGNPDCEINELQITTGNLFSSANFLKLSNFGTGSLTVNGMKCHVGQWNGGTKPTNFITNAGRLSVINGDFRTPSIGDFNPTALAEYVGWHAGNDGAANPVRWRGEFRIYDGPLNVVSGGARVQAGGIRSDTRHFISEGMTIADNATSTIDLASDGINLSGALLVASQAANVGALISYFCDASPVATSLAAGSKVNVVTGVDLSAESLPYSSGNLSIAINDGEVQFLNEVGFSVFLVPTFFTKSG